MMIRRARGRSRGRVRDVHPRDRGHVVSIVSIVSIVVEDEHAHLPIRVIDVERDHRLGVGVTPVPLEREDDVPSVSYTHLTLPTILLV